MTAEQAVAFGTLRALAAPGRLRVRPDPEGFPILPGRYGQVEWYDGRDLAAWSDRPRLFAKLVTIPAVRRHQTGDGEFRVLFAVDALAQVAGVLRLRRRRTLSPEAARQKGARTAYRATSAA